LRHGNDLIVYVDGLTSGFGGRLVHRAQPKPNSSTRIHRARTAREYGHQPGRLARRRAHRRRPRLCRRRQPARHPAPRTPPAAARSRPFWCKPAQATIRPNRPAHQRRR
jgi:hypothetical protein